MTEEIFKAPRTKRPHSKQDLEPGGLSPPKRGRTKDDFYTFCSWVLAYTQYESNRQEELRAQHNLSPLDSGVSSGDSYSSDMSSISSSSRDDASANVDLDNSEDESWDLITCHCMKPYAGRPMIECSTCKTWIHLSCAKIRKSNIPDTFVCQNCKDNCLTTRKSIRRRFEKKRITI